MPFTEPVKSTDPIETVRKIARMAQVLLDLKQEYERRQRDDQLEQIRYWATELYNLAKDLPVPPPTEKANDPDKKQA
jgi:hypothetical protein